MKEMFFLFFCFLILLFVIWIWINKILKNMKNEMTNAFKSLSFDVIEKNNHSFIDLANSVMGKYHESAKYELESKKKDFTSIVAPIAQTLNKVNEHNREIEKQREADYCSLSKQIDLLKNSENLLRAETSNLVKALKSPTIRGTWGQVHLRRVVELAGLLNHCDFFEQKTKTDTDYKSYRPDMVVYLPGERQIVIDSKTPLDAYLEAIDIDDYDKKKQKLKCHAEHVSKHIKGLSSKEYWRQFDQSPEYVILFLPAESFFSAALQEKPQLLEYSASKNVIVATPTTLIAILRSVSYVWKQESISKSTKEISKLGSELYERLFVMNNHFSSLGKSLSKSIESYNSAISSLESRVLVSARKLKDLQVSHGEKKLSFLEEINKTTRSIYK